MKQRRINYGFFAFIVLTVALFVFGAMVGPPTKAAAAETLFTAYNPALATDWGHVPLVTASTMPDLNTAVGPLSKADLELNVNQLNQVANWVTTLANARMAQDATGGVAARTPYEELMNPLAVLGTRVQTVTTNLPFQIPKFPDANWANMVIPAVLLTAEDFVDFAFQASGELSIFSIADVIRAALAEPEKYVHAGFLNTAADASAIYAIYVFIDIGFSKMPITQVKEQDVAVPANLKVVMVLRGPVLKLPNFNENGISSRARTEPLTVYGSLLRI